MISGRNFIKLVLENTLVVPMYQAFSKTFKHVFDDIKEDKEKKYSWGEKASYIPSLLEAEDEWFASAFCSADG